MAGAVSPEGPGQAHGVRFTGPVPALAPGGDGLPECAVEGHGADAVGARWPPGPAEVLAERRAIDGSTLVRVEARGRDLRVWGLGHGSAVVLDGGRAIALAPPEGPPWLRPRLLVAQTLPLVATLHGRELLHAAAVEVGGRVLALTAASGAGKSSVALHLQAAGAAFVTDDALALSLEGDAVLAHPGPRFANVPRGEAAALTGARAGLVGEPLGTTDELHVAPAGSTASRPLAAVVVLERARAAADPTPVEDVTVALLGAAYLPYVRDPGRLVHQLEVAAAVARTVPVVRCPVGPDEGAAGVAARLAAWAHV